MNNPVSKYVIGVDEVGRGPIAGPVAVGVFVFLCPKSKKLFNGVKESKQLSEKKREEWFVVINKCKKEGLVDYVVTLQSHSIIDARGISFAINKALEISLKKLGINCNRSRVLLDGGLKAPPEYKDQKTIIKGDEKEMVIALASICAKVTRDRAMVKLAKSSKKYAQYGFEKHKGYGTREHYSAIKRFGLLPIHRRSFVN